MGEANETWQIRYVSVRVDNLGRGTTYLSSTAMNATPMYPRGGR